jgi:hypothetical protein
MYVGSRTILGVALVVIVTVLWPVPTVALTEPVQESPQMVEDVFTEVQLLRGIPVDEFWDTMGMFAAALGKDCVDCHVLEAVDNWEAFSEETPMIRTARGMIQMVQAINQDNFGGAQLVTCFTCHQGTSVPENVPDLALQYGVPPDKPNALQIFPSPLAPSAEELFDRYLEELGGVDRLSNVTSIAATGTYAGYETGHQDIPVEIYIQAPDRQARINHGAQGDSVSVYDGSNGWVAAAGFPLPVMPLTGGKLANARLEAMLAFPADLQEAFNQWRVGITIIDDRDVYVVQGTRSGELPVNFYFDDSGLLVRVVHWNQTAMGMVPTQLDFEDYGEVSGIRMPFRWTVSWTTGQTTTQLDEVELNVPIAPARFNRPNPAGD